MLDTGVIKKVYQDQDSSQAPFTIEIVHIKPIALSDGAMKYRLVVADGEWQCQGFAEGLALEKMQREGVDRYAVIKVLDYSLMEANTRQLMVVKDFDLVNLHGEKLNMRDLKSISDAVKVPQKQSPSPAPSRPAPSAGGRKVMAIEAISPYANTWTIKARVSFKLDMRTWTNQKGTGKLITIHFLDELDEIRATAFNETAERAEKELQEGKVYYLSKALVKAANKKFNTLANAYELTLERDSVWEECFDTVDVPKINYNFVKLDQIQNLEVGTVVDVIGVLKDVGDEYTITSKTNNTFSKRNLSIVDQSGFAIEVGLWNQTAKTFAVPSGLVVAFKLCKIGEFNGQRSLSLAQAGSFMADPDSPELYLLKGWYDNEGKSSNFTELKRERGGGWTEERKTIQEAVDENLGRSEKPDYFTIRALVSYLRTKGTFAYPACPNEVEFNSRKSTCNRKLVEEGGQWRCERCDQTFDAPTYRYVLSVSLLDELGQVWATFFDAEGTQLVGKTANEMMELIHNTSEENHEVTAVWELVVWKEFLFRIKARLDSYNDQERVRYQVVQMAPVDYDKDSVQLATELEKLLL